MGIKANEKVEDKPYQFSAKTGGLNGNLMILVLKMTGKD